LSGGSNGGGKQILRTPSRRVMKGEKRPILRRSFHHGGNGVLSSHRRRMAVVRRHKENEGMRWSNGIVVLCILLSSSSLQAVEGKTGFVVKVVDRLVYVDLGKSDGVRVGDLFQVFHKTGEGSEEMLGTIRAILVEDRVSVMELMEEGVKIAELDLVRPTVILLHEPPSSWSAGEALPLSVTLKAGGVVDNAVIVYRMAGSETWVNEGMVRDGDQSFRGTIPGRAVLPPFLEYFLQITIQSGRIIPYGNSEQPISVVIRGEGRQVVGNVKRPGRWRLIIPGLYQMSEGRIGTGMSLAVLELGFIGGGMVLWPKPDVEKYRRERQWTSKGLWGLGAVTFLYSVIDSFTGDDERRETARLSVEPDVLLGGTYGGRIIVRL
jgi:hypothetical protein